MARLFVSASTTLSDPSRWGDLLWPGIDGIEVGFLAPGDLAAVAALVSQHGLEWGVHSPLYRGGHSNDLLGPDGLLPEPTTQLRREIETVAPLGARYLLVHFPRFAGDEGSPLAVEAGLQGLLGIQADTGMPLILEPKLGIQRHPGGIDLLYRLGTDALASARLCLDLGDWWLAAKELGIPFETLIEPFLPLAASFHVHHVYEVDERYVWTPVHPSTDTHFGFMPVLRAAVNQNPGVMIVIEHTPHLVPSESYVREGVEWLKGALASGRSANPRSSYG